MPVDTDFQAIAQAYLSPQIASTYFLRDPKLWLLANFTGERGQATNLEIGRPSGQFIFQGTNLSPIEKLQLSGVNAYKPQFQYQNPTNVKIAGARDTGAQLTAPTTGSQDQIQGTAEVRWTGLIEEQIVIWNETLTRAVSDSGSNMKGRGIARASVIERATKLATQNVFNTLATEFQSGAPSDQDADPWDHLLGFATWFSATNICARVDRAATKNAQWRAIVDNTARAPVISDLIDVANIDNNIADLSEDGVVVFLVNNAQFKVMKAECLGKGFVEMTTNMPQMAKYGAKNQFVLQKDNVFVVRDRKVPASTCYALVPKVWKFITHPDFTLRVTPFRNMKEYNVAGPDYLQAFVQLRCMLSCDNPAVNMAFTNITDPS